LDCEDVNDIVIVCDAASPDTVQLSTCVPAVILICDGDIVPEDADKYTVPVVPEVFSYPKFPDIVLTVVLVTPIAALISYVGGEVGVLVGVLVDVDVGVGVGVGVATYVYV
jgi:hypothetical protein